MSFLYRLVDHYFSKRFNLYIKISVPLIKIF